MNIQILIQKNHKCPAVYPILILSMPTSGSYDMRSALK